MACGLPVIHTSIGPTSEFVPEDGGWPIPAERAPLRAGTRLPELVADGYVHEADPHALAEILREVAAKPEERRSRAASAHARAQDYHWERVAAIAERSFATLAEEELPLARETGVAQLEHRGELVLYAPDWDDEDSWGPTVERWAAAVRPADPITLALHLPEGGDPNALAERVLGRLHAAGHSDDDLPDLALPEPGSVSLASLVAGADAVLVDPASVGRPDLCRRARRVLEASPEGLLDYAAAVRSDASGLPEQISRH
jgi:hypothetical protein